jgi:hypothetical protein
MTQAVNQWFLGTTLEDQCMIFLASGRARWTTVHATRLHAFNFSVAFDNSIFSGT